LDNCAALSKKAALFALAAWKEKEYTVSVAARRLPRGRRKIS